MTAMRQYLVRARLIRLQARLHTASDKASHLPTLSNAKPPPESAKAKAMGVGKILSDLWIHQNNLVWGRLQILYWIQFGFIGAALVAHHQVEESFKEVAYWPCVVAACLSVLVLIVMLGDMFIRNHYRRHIEQLDVDVFPGSFNQKPFAEDYGARYFESLMYIAICLFFAWMDLWVASMLGWPWWSRFLDAVYKHW